MEPRSAVSRQPILGTPAQHGGSWAASVANHRSFEESLLTERTKARVPSPRTCRANAKVAKTSVVAAANAVVAISEIGVVSQVAGDVPSHSLERLGASTDTGRNSLASTGLLVSPRVNGLSISTQPPLVLPPTESENMAAPSVAITAGTSRTAQPTPVPVLRHGGASGSGSVPVGGAPRDKRKLGGATPVTSVQPTSKLMFSSRLQPASQAGGPLPTSRRQSIGVARVPTPAKAAGSVTPPPPLTQTVAFSTALTRATRDEGQGGAVRTNPAVRSQLSCVAQSPPQDSGIRSVPSVGGSATARVEHVRAPWKVLPVASLEVTCCSSSIPTVSCKDLMTDSGMSLLAHEQACSSHGAAVAALFQRRLDENTRQWALVAWRLFVADARRARLSQKHLLLLAFHRLQRHGETCQREDMAHEMTLQHARWRADDSRRRETAAARLSAVQGRWRAYILRGPPQTFCFHVKLARHVLCIWKLSSSNLSCNVALQPEPVHGSVNQQCYSKSSFVLSRALAAWARSPLLGRLSRFGTEHSKLRRTAVGRAVFRLARAGARLASIRGEWLLRAAMVGWAACANCAREAQALLCCCRTMCAPGSTGNKHKVGGCQVDVGFASELNMPPQTPRREAPVRSNGDILERFSRRALASDGTAMTGEIAASHFPWSKAAIDPKNFDLIHDEGRGSGMESEAVSTTAAEASEEGPTPSRPPTLEAEDDGRWLDSASEHDTHLDIAEFEPVPAVADRLQGRVRAMIAELQKSASLAEACTSPVRPEVTPTRSKTAKGLLTALSAVVTPETPEAEIAHATSPESGKALQRADDATLERTATTLGESPTIKSAWHSFTPGHRCTSDLSEDVQSTLSTAVPGRALFNRLAGPGFRLTMQPSPLDSDEDGE
eukprot:TRINITY_DN4007_c0_g3_i1.p1 TRINITY_DN4007_c0_g3~~TRINITY_DN4007_c0_g3_i1.p1  ORF type:complete len:923 (+),score=118.30 TRINITY_DN4007_c0_g3_i1:101-2770(+)